MVFKRPSANTPKRLEKRSTASNQAFACGIGQNVSNEDNDSHSQLPRPATNESSSREDRATLLATESNNNDVVETEYWTQIPGPTDEEMSDSDTSSIVGGVQSQVPNEIREAEEDASLETPGIHIEPEIHRRYKGFTVALCRETANEDIIQHVLDGLSLAITTAKSLRLNTDGTQDAQLDLYAFALVIHIWQIVCLRKQHGKFPSEDMEESLCLGWTAYFLSAHAIVEQRRKVSADLLRSAVQYWEVRLRLKGDGNRWMEDRWAKDIPQDDQEAKVHRNETADRYLESLAEYGKTGLAVRIIEEEKKGGQTQLRSMTLESPDAAREACRQLAYMLYSMDTTVLKAMIQGQLPRLAEIASGEVCRQLRILNQGESIQPGTYMNCICDFVGLSPTPTQWLEVCALMLKYVQGDDEYNDLAELVDQKVHPKYRWSKELAHKGLRRYTEWRSYVERDSYHPDRDHRRWVKYFVDQLKQRMVGQPVHAPLSVPVVEIGFSNDPHKRLRQHRHHERSNYLMNLAEAAFETVYPGAFKLQQNIIYACFRPIQTWLSEIMLTQLAQGYVEGGGGFSHEIAGWSNSVSNAAVPFEVWNLFEAGVYANGQFLQEVQASISTRRAENEEMSRQRRLQESLDIHRRNVDALKDANERLKEARDRLYP